MEVYRKLRSIIKFRKFGFSSMQCSIHFPKYKKGEIINFKETPLWERNLV